MALEGIEKLDTTLVVLRDPDTRLQIVVDDLAQFVKEPTVEQAVGPVSALRVTSVREQIEVTLDPRRVAFSDKSDVIPGRARFPEIASDILSFLVGKQATFLGYGWNYSVAFDNPQGGAASATILQLFLHQSDLQERGMIQPVGGAVKLFYRQDAALCTLDLEPRLGKVETERFYARVNFHFADKPPDMSKEGIDREFQTYYERFMDTVERLLETRQG